MAAILRGQAFAGKLITITGAARGIGKATASYLAARGANLSLSDYRARDLQRVQEEIAQNFPNITVVHSVVDVSKSSEVNDWIRLTKEKFGKIDGCVNNAG